MTRNLIIKNEKTFFESKEYIELKNNFFSGLPEEFRNADCWDSFIALQWEIYKAGQVSMANMLNQALDKMIKL
jgi:hypothetical protein